MFFSVRRSIACQSGFYLYHFVSTLHIHTDIMSPVQLVCYESILNYKTINKFVESFNVKDTSDQGNNLQDKTCEIISLQYHKMNYRKII